MFLMSEVPLSRRGSQGLASVPARVPAAAFRRIHWIILAEYRGTSLIRNTPTPHKHHRALGMVLP